MIRITSHGSAVRRAVWPALALAVCLADGPPTGASAPAFYPDDPLWKSTDSQDASGVQERDINLFYDTLENSFYRPGDRTPDVRAQNINTVDEVPDSNWFTNRIGMRPMTADELLRGGDTVGGPAPGVWTIVAAKNDGASPGFTVRDSRGEVWFIKFDPPGYRAMATGTEVVVSRLFWALGYFVPEVHIATLRPDQLAIDDGARITPPSGKRRRFVPDDVRVLLRRAHRDPDGSYRVIASRRLEGRPVGGFLFYGTRPDDPNDVIPHEHRRELRAYGTFAAWVNHVDSKSINTLDTVVEQDGRKVVRHHLLDFGSTIGSSGLFPREPFEGWEHLVQGTDALKGMATFGFYIKDWRTIPLYRARSVGAFPSENSAWDPERWKSRYPNSAFRSARLDDKFWAARRLQGFTDDMLKAVARLGAFDDPASEAMIARFLIERRDAIVRRYLSAVNPVVDLELTGDGILRFHNATVDAGVAAPPPSYEVRWQRFDNATAEATAIGTTSATTTSVAPPPGLPSAAGTWIRADISATGGPDSWATPARAYFLRERDAWKLVGFERLPPGNPPQSLRTTQSKGSRQP